MLKKKKVRSIIVHLDQSADDLLETIKRIVQLATDEDATLWAIHHVDVAGSSAGPAGGGGGGGGLRRSQRKTINRLPPGKINFGKEKQKIIFGRSDQKSGIYDDEVVTITAAELRRLRKIESYYKKQTAESAGRFKARY